tara:strand:+ start:278 stop:700 length:423 start_codon:yes stop_codon:yes gene_type:complete
MKINSKKFLVMGLPGAGKTTLANKLSTKITAIRINADEIRKKYNDWDFSDEGRNRQAKRMRKLSDDITASGKNVITDFVCPTDKTRDDFDADYIIWLDTITKGRFEDTNKMFVPPKKYFLRVTSKDAEYWVDQIIMKLSK